MHDGSVVGTITSGDWGHRVGKNIAYAFVDPDMADEGTEMALDLLGQQVPAKVITAIQYDPDHSRMRA